jgi:hypothetical protein
MDLLEMLITMIRKAENDEPVKKDDLTKFTLSVYDGFDNLHH